MLCLFFLLPLAVSANELLPNESWLQILQLSNVSVSSPCQADLDAWMADLLAISKDGIECLRMKSCSNGTLKDMEKRLYALKQLDAFGRPPPALLDATFTMGGSPRECQEVNDHYIYRTQYCYAYSQLGDECNPTPKESLKTAVCMPRSCSEEEITNILGSIELPKVQVCNTKCIPEYGETNAFTWVFFGFMAALILILVVASFLDFWLESVYGKNSKDIRHPGLRILFAFSIYTNGSTILDTKPQRADHIKSLDCMRFFSMFWVVCGHVACLWVSNDSLSPLPTLTKPILSDTIASAFFSVDTFFTLSGIVVSYMFFKMALKNRRIVKQPMTWIMFYVHRYLRLTPPYMIFICFYIAVVPLLVGVVALELQSAATVQVCRDYWWRNMLYINNFQMEHMCYGITWYLSVDTQIYIIAPIFLVALYISHALGVISLVAMCAVSVGLTFYETYHFNLPASLLRPEDPTQIMEFFNKLYAKPWIRITPYLIGIWTGYLLANVRKPKVRVSPILIILGWIFFVGIALACVYGPYEYLAFNINWSKFTRSSYYSFSRIGWAMFICWVVVANHYGWGGPIATFMDHPLWQPFGRLSYCAYLCHYFLIDYFVNLLDRPLHFVSIWEQTLGYSIPITVMAFVFAFFWSSLCEIPFLKLEKMGVDALIGRKVEKPAEEKKIKEIWEVEDDVKIDLTVVKL